MGQTGKALSRTATQLPLTAISLSLQAWERSRPLRAFALRRSNEALQIAAHTPLGRLLPKQIFNDDADAEAADIVADARRPSRPRSRSLSRPRSRQPRPRLRPRLRPRPPPILQPNPRPSRRRSRTI